jgi:general transcription factor 3C polypeptide 3 (transcription factor C subunit 4)
MPLPPQLYQGLERIYLSAKDLVTGEVVVPQEMDPVLLMLYAHQLYYNSTFTGTLSYLWRAHAIIAENGHPGDPLLFYTMGLSYIGYSLKRQAGNRHMLIAQGFSYLFKYYDMRTGKSDNRVAVAEERMEAEYNMGRTYHSIGEWLASARRGDSFRRTCIADNMVLADRAHSSGHSLL